MVTTFYPALNSVINLDVLPEELSFVKDGADDLLSKLFFKDLQYSRSPRGDAAHYSLKLVSLKRIDFSIPGTGFLLVLNPHLGAPGDPTQFIGEFPIVIDWEWPILAYLQAFRTEGFSFDGGAFYDLAVQVFNLPGDRMVEEALALFYPGPVALATAQFVDAINANPNYDGLPHPTSANPASEIAAAITALFGQTASRVIFEVFVFDSNDDSVSLEKVALLFGRVLGENVLDYLKKLLIPKIKATLQLSAALEFPREVLVPMDAGGNPDPDPAVKSMLVFTTPGVSLQFSTEKGFGYDEELQATLTPSQIGNTGLGISIESAKLDLSRGTNIAEADQDGRPKDFVGVYITKASITLPQFLNHDDAGSTAEIYAERLLVGTGGVSGVIGLRAKDPLNATPALVKASLGEGFELGLSGFDLTFQQNQITGSNIRGFMKVPKFKDTEGNDALINITAHIDANGDFSVVASEEQGIRALSIPDVLDVIVKTVSVGRTSGRYFIAVAGELDFKEQGPPIGQFVPDKIEIQKLIIWADGNFEFEGGKLTLPQAISLSIGPVKLSVTAIGFGSHEQDYAGVLRAYKYFTFDGGISVNPGGVDVSGKGVAFYYTVDNNELPVGDPAARPPDRFMRIQSISVDIILPGNATAKNAAVIIKGFLSMQEPTPPATGSEYSGGIELTLPKLKMGGSAAMRLNPSVPAFIVDAGFEMATPILIGATGLGIYGFRGLLGMRYVASRQQIGLTDTDPWWQYYKKKVAPDNKEGVQASKFAQRDGFSLGAGVSLATSLDSGRTFSAKIFFLLSLPEVFLLQGQGQILKERIGLDTTQDPPFFAMISISSTSLETAFGVNYKIPDEGDKKGAIATLDGVLEMGFFFANSDAWYVNLGRDTPDERRIQARLFTVFDVYSYLMLSHSGIRTGGGAAYNLEKKWGPLKAELSAYMDVAGRMSRHPKQIGASIQIGGTVELSIFGCGFGLSGDASLAAEGIKPFMVAGSLKVCVKILWKHYCGTFDFTLIFDPSLDLSEISILGDLLAAGKALAMHTGEGFGLWTGATLPSLAALESFMVPMDSYIDLDLAKSVKIAPSVSDVFGGSAQGANFLEYFPPQRAKSDRVRHEYSLQSVDILYHNGAGWVPYDIYAAATPLQLAPFITTDLSTLPYGYWQNQSSGEYTKLRVMAPSPLNYLSQGTGDTPPEDLGITVETIFCADDPIKQTCLSFDTWHPEAGTPIHLTRNQLYFHQFLHFRVTGGDGALVDRPAGSYKRAVQADSGESIELYFPEGYPEITVHLSVCSETAQVSYYERIEAPAPHGPSGQPVYLYRLILTKPMIPAPQVVKVDYNDLHRPVDKVVISTGMCRKDEPHNCKVNAKYARLLLSFVGALIENQHLTGPLVELSEAFYTAYKGVFFETPLYTNASHPHVRYSVTLLDFAQLHAEVTDDAGFRCALDLAVDPKIGGIDWRNVSGIADLSPILDSGNPQLFTAKLTVLIDGSAQSVRVSGKSCYPLLDCKKSKPATHMAAFLTLLASSGRLGRPMLSLDETEREAYCNLVEMSGEFTPVRLSTYNNVADTELRLLLNAGDRGRSEILLRPTRSSNSLRFDLIRQFENLRAISVTGDGIAWSGDAVLASGARTPVEIEITGKRPGASMQSSTAPAPVVPPCGIGCSADLSPAARALEDFLNTLLIRNMMFRKVGASVELSPKNGPIFSGIFQGSALYPDPPEGSVIRSVVTLQSNAQIDFEVVDNSGFKCSLSLCKISGPEKAGIKDLLALRNLRLDPAAPVDQPVYSFLADAVFRVGGKRLLGILRGKSCVPLNVCGPKCETLLYGVCVLSYPDAIHNYNISTQATVTEDVQTMINAFNGSIQPIWRPYTNYAIRLRTQDTLFRENSSTVEHAHPVRTSVFAFRTTGPLGHFHAYLDAGNASVERPDYQALKLRDRQDEFKLKDVLHYVDFAKCYPNADGELLNAKPLFYLGPRLSLFFLKPYVYEMMRSWDDLPGSDGTDIKFDVTIKEPAPDPTAAQQGATEMTWDLSPLPVISTEVRVINNMITYGSPCANVAVIDPVWVSSTAELPDLRPLKLYTALFNVRLKRNNAAGASVIAREVLRYAFQTSRYGSFEEQVNSWRLKVTGTTVERAAVFTLEFVAKPETGSLAEQVLADTLADEHSLRKDFGDPFNRLIDGVFQLTNLHPPVTTEFNAVCEAATGRLFGLLIRNPEPFNDPKMPDTEIAGTLSVSVNGSAVSAWRALWSKDRSQVFLTNSDNSLNLPAGASAVFTFVYKHWDGGSYATISIVITSPIQLP